MIENNTIFLPRVQCISIPIAKIKFFKRIQWGKNKLLWRFRAHISYIHRVYCLTLPISQNLTGVRPTLRTCKFILF